ncbi:MAG: hypothetical protein AAF495_17040 [Pseudomonadota bacterium]
MQSQLKSFEDSPVAPAQPTKSPNWWLEVRRAKAPADPTGQVTDLTQQFLAERETPAAETALQVDLSYPRDRMAEAFEVLEILEDLGHRVIADQADWLPTNTKAVMVWWKPEAKAQATALYERLKTIETMNVTLAAEPAVPQMIGDIQIALGRDI